MNLVNPLDLDAPTPKDIADEIDKYITNKLASFDESNAWVSREQYAENLHRIKEMYMKDSALFIDNFKYDDDGKMTDGIREFLSSLGYDGIVSKQETVAFYPEQIKETTNKNPTSNPDIRFQKKRNADATRGVYINDSTQAFTEQILNGEKTIETREQPMNRQYPELHKFVGKRVGIVRTGKGKTTLVGFATIADEVIGVKQQKKHQNWCFFLFLSNFRMFLLELVIVLILGCLH